jgi:hypothetical protein
MKYTKEEQKQAYEVLIKYRGQNFGACIKSVSRSGMCRRIEFYSNDFNRIGYYIARLIEYPYNVDKGGLQVTGCGMDMIFHVLSSLNYTMARLDGVYDKLKNEGKRIYDDYFTNAERYTLL